MNPLCQFPVASGCDLGVGKLPIFLGFLQHQTLFKVPWQLPGGLIFRGPKTGAETLRSYAVLLAKYCRHFISGGGHFDDSVTGWSVSQYLLGVAGYAL